MNLGKYCSAKQFLTLIVRCDTQPEALATRSGARDQTTPGSTCRGGPQGVDHDEEFRRDAEVRQGASGYRDDTIRLGVQGLSSHCFGSHGLLEEVVRARERRRGKA